MSSIDLSAAASQVSQSLLPSAASAATTSSSPGSSTSTGTNVSSSDFLTLLVTEMKNQDPTQPTDPNAYIQQLVGVNSLQQLIAINQDLTSTTSAAATQTDPVAAA